MSSVTDRSRQARKVIFSQGILQLNHSPIFTIPGVVACTCNPATLKAQLRNGLGSLPVRGNSPSIGGWIV